MPTHDNVPVMAPDLDGKPKRSHVERRINHDEAIVVRRIFQMYAAGTGLTTLAKTLNQDRVPPPRKGRHGWLQVPSEKSCTVRFIVVYRFGIKRRLCKLVTPRTDGGDRNRNGYALKFHIYELFLMRNGRESRNDLNIRIASTTFR